MIIIINKLQIYGKRFCEKRVRGSNLGGEVRFDALTPALSHREREKGTDRRSGKRSATRQ